MPCYSEPLPTPTTAEIRRECQREFEHNSRLAEMFCAVLRSLENTGKMPGLYGTLPSKMQKRVDTWWTEHRERDNKRIAAEAKRARTTQVRSQALNKLTDEELKILGLSKET